MQIENRDIFWGLFNFQFFSRPLIVARIGYLFLKVDFITKMDKKCPQTCPTNKKGGEITCKKRLVEAFALKTSLVFFYQHQH